MRTPRAVTAPARPAPPFPLGAHLCWWAPPASGARCAPAVAWRSITSDDLERLGEGVVEHVVDATGTDPIRSGA